MRNIMSYLVSIGVQFLLRNFCELLTLSLLGFIDYSIVSRHSFIDDEAIEDNNLYTAQDVHVYQ